MGLRQGARQAGADGRQPNRRPQGPQADARRCGRRPHPARHRPFSFLLSAVDTKMPKLAESAMAALVNDGPIFATRIRYLQAYITAVAHGKTGPEVDRSLETEVDNLWGELQRLAASGAQHAAAKDRLAS